MNFKSLDLLAAVATESGIAGAAKLSELPKDAWTASSSASAETLSLQEQPLRLAVNDAQRHSTVTSSTSSLSERLASSLSRSTSPNVSTRVGLKNGKKRLDDGTSEEVLRMRGLNRDRVRRYNIRQKVSKGVQPGEFTFTQAEMDDAYKDRRLGFKIGSTTPAAKEKRAAKRALAQKRKVEAKAQAARATILEAKTRLATATFAFSKSFADKMLPRPGLVWPQARGALPAAKDGSSFKGAAPVSEGSLASTSSHTPLPLASWPAEREQETQASGKAEQSMLPDLNLPPPDTQ